MGPAGNGAGSGNRIGLKALALIMIVVPISSQRRITSL
jgi:hypothetical protein